MKTDGRNDLLKIIAIVTMLIDHIGVLLLPELDFLRTIGRISFPIFCYFIANGYRYTSNRKKYFTRIVVFALISQVPYMFLSYGAKFHPLHFNVLFLFAYSIIVLHFIDRFKDNKFIATLITMVLILIPVILQTNVEGFAFSYGYYGILLVMIFYIFHNDNTKILISFVLLSLIYPYISVAIYKGSDIGFFASFINYKYILPIIDDNSSIWGLSGLFYQARSILGILLIFAFSRFKFSYRINKYFFYTFYPVHITVLLLIRYFMGIQ